MSAPPNADPQGPRTRQSLRRGRDIRQSASIFAALGDQTRLRLVGRLAAGEPLSIAQLTEGTGVTRQAITKHLGVLDRAGVVSSRWEGRERIWELEAARLEMARQSLDIISARWAAALGRFKALVEKDMP